MEKDDEFCKGLCLCINIGKHFFTEHGPTCPLAALIAARILRLFPSQSRGVWFKTPAATLIRFMARGSRL